MNRLTKLLQFQHIIRRFNERGRYLVKKKVFIALPVLGLVFFLAGCVDPNESGVPDGIDFKSSTVTHNRVNVITDIVFYSNYSSMDFFYYFDHDSDGDADFLVRCGAGSFTVSKESSPGLYDILKYSGTPVVSGATYHIEFPLAALELNPAVEFNTRYWFFEMTKGDRMPDSGSKLLANIL
ncbi:MAG: hypothetical protein VST71_01240 [Nitrospirota bacterium]|nr:hypothetical protein [Nitrospirota bacterium]